MATICATVFSLPSMCTATLRDAPMWAIHSRNAEIAISRPMMISAISGSTRPCPSSTSRLAQISSLSATGSRKDHARKHATSQPAQTAGDQHGQPG